MAHIEIIASVKNAVTRKGLPESAASRILAWLDQAETGIFAASEQREQLHKILEAMDGFVSGDQEDE